MENKVENIEKERIREENERKKKYLWQYQECKRELERLEAERIEVRLNKMFPSIVQDGMPHASGCSDLSGYASKVDELDRKIMKTIYKRIQTLTDIRNRINAVKNQSEREVLTYRYIRGMKWGDIARKMKYERESVIRIHGKALINFKI